MKGCGGQEHEQTKNAGNKNNFNLTRKRFAYAVSKKWNVHDGKHFVVRCLCTWECKMNKTKNRILKYMKGKEHITVNGLFHISSKEACRRSLRALESMGMVQRLQPCNGNKYIEWRLTKKGKQFRQSKKYTCSMCKRESSFLCFWRGKKVCSGCFIKLKLRAK